jgi:AraC-like DNA-binding protein
MNCFVREAWDSGGARGGDAYEAWVDKLMSAQGSDWCPGKTPAGAFSASLRHKVIGEINVIESRCDPCTGYRTARHVESVEEPAVVLLSYLEGGEHIEFGGERYTVAAGDTFVWDSSKTTKFEVYESLHKVAFAMPARLLSHHALSALNQMPRKFDRSSGSRFLLSNLIRVVADRDFDDAEVEADTILNAVNAFVLGARPGDADHDNSLSERQRREILRYIDQHLPDPALSVSHIAAVHRISKRYLHWLFRDQSVTVNELIILKRLEGCQRDLSSLGGAHLQVGQIAYAWGFSNISHFSKRYRAQYGESPTETRQRAAAAAMAAD